MFKRTFVVVMVALLVVTGLALPNRARVTAQDEIQCFGSEGSEVSIIASWTGDEETKFRSVLAPVLDACDISLNYEGSRDMNTLLPTRVQGGDAPDLAAFANPGALVQFADDLVDLTTLDVNGDNYVQGWKDLGSANGTWIGLAVKTDIKSLVWYSPLSFEIAGYTVPTTWDEFVALMDQMVADGDVPPLSMGFESGGATGWTATDFVQDILLRTQGTAYTNGLVTGETAWSDQGVVDAWTLFADWVETYGEGSETVRTTSFGDAILKPFQDPPAAWMVKQSGFAGSAFVQPTFPDYVFGEDFAFFTLPSAGEEPAAMQVGGDFMGAFNDTPAVHAIIAYLSSAAGATSWAAAAFDLTPNSAVDLSAYADPISAAKAEALGAAPDVSYDVGDLLPAGVGQAEFDGITAVVGGADAAETLAAIQSVLEEATAGS